MTPRRQWDPAPLVVKAGDPLRVVARRLGIDPAVLCRPLSDRQADLYATKLGYHPLDVWGNDWWD